MRHLRALGLLFVLAVVCIPNLHAQSQATTGVIEGTVVDETGAALAGASVVVLNTATNFKVAATAGGDGRFRAVLLPLGPYEVTVEADGFAKLLRSGLDLAVGQTINLRLEMKLSTVEDQITVTGEAPVVETSRTRCNYLVTQLPASTLVLNGDSTDEDLLSDEGVAEMDLFIAVTSDDENNIMSCMLAKRMGARRTIALINRQAYADLVEGNRIDIAIVPSQTTIGKLLTHVRRGDVVAVHSLRRGAAEALEAIAHGDPKSSKVVGKRIEQIDLPRGATIGAIVRSAEGGPLGPLRGRRDAPQFEVIMAHHDTVIRSEDHVIVFVENKRIIPKVEKLFEVGVGFF